MLMSVIGMGVVLGGCSSLPSGSTTQSSAPSPVVTLNGVIISKNGGYMISLEGKNTDLDSRKIDLKSYIGKTVSVTGEFSGTTLFVDSIK